MTDLASLDRQLMKLELALSERETEYNRLEIECQTLERESDLLYKVDAVLQAVSSKVLGQSTDVIDKLVTSGLQAIFDDLDLEFKTVVDKYRGKTSVKFELYHDGKSGPLTDSFGGGILCVIGVLLRIATIIVLGMRRVIILDESLAHLSQGYHENASSFLKTICKDLGFTVLMVTHAESFVTHADHHYEAKDTPTGATFVLK